MLTSSVDVNSHCQAGNIPLALKEKTTVGIGFKLELWGKIAKAGFLVPQTPLRKWNLDGWLHKSWMIRHRCRDVRQLLTSVNLVKPKDPPSEDSFNDDGLLLRNHPHAEDADSDPSSRDGGSDPFSRDGDSDPFSRDDDSIVKADGPSSRSPSSDKPVVYFPPPKNPHSSQARTSPPSNAASPNPAG